MITVNKCTTIQRSLMRQRNYIISKYITNQTELCVYVKHYTLNNVEHESDTCVSDTCVSDTCVCDKLVSVIVKLFV